VEWLFSVLSRKDKYGQLRKVLVRKPDGAVAGWYIYYANPGGLSEVLQIGAKGDSIKLVLDHLVTDRDNLR